MFGELLKTWRKSEGLSQMALSLRSDVSQRHLSFLESGRARPSEDMVLHLGDILGLSLRHQNALLTSAGVAPRFSESQWQSAGLEPVQKAVDFMLKQHEPFPAWVVDARWRMLQANRSARVLMNVFMEELPLLFCDDGLPNVMRLTLHPQGMAPYIENLNEVATHLLQRLQQEARYHPETENLYAELKEYFPELKPTVSTVGHSPVMSTRFVKDGLSLDLFSMITTLGTPTDIMLQELRIESLFPANEQSEVLLKQFLSHATDE